MNQLSKWLLLMVGLPTHSAHGSMPGLCLKDSPPRRPYLTSYAHDRAPAKPISIPPRKVHLCGTRCPARRSHQGHSSDSGAKLSSSYLVLRLRIFSLGRYVALGNKCPCQLARRTRATLLNCKDSYLVAIRGGRSLNPRSTGGYYRRIDK